MATEPTKEENGASSKGKWTGNKKRKEKDVFIYGNYKSYYGYRVFFPFHFQLIFIAISPYFSHTVMKQQIESKQMIISLVVRFRVYKKEFEWKNWNRKSKTFCLIEQIDRNTKEDPRLAVFKKEWFEGKDCLDIGCNQGIVTIAIGNLLLITCLLFYVEINWLKSSSPLWL